MSNFEELKDKLIAQLSGKGGKASQILASRMRDAHSIKDLEDIANWLANQRAVNQDNFKRKRRSLQAHADNLSQLESEYNASKIQVDRDLTAEEYKVELDQIAAIKRICLMHLRNVQALSSMIHKTEELVAQYNLGVSGSEIDQLADMYADAADVWDAALDAELELKEVLPETIEIEKPSSIERSMSEGRVGVEPAKERGLPEQLRKRKQELLGPEAD